MESLKNTSPIYQSISKEFTTGIIKSRILMDKKSKYVIALFLTMVAVSMAMIFLRYIVLEDISFYTDEELFNQSLLEE